MITNSRTALMRDYGADTTEDIIGVLTAISVVSKRMARKLAQLEQSKRKVGKRNGATRKSISANAT